MRRAGCPLKTKDAAAGARSLRHGDCCDADADCGGSLKCDTGLRVCTAGCSTDAVRGHTREQALVTID
jgi:hypothetical protein